MTKISTPHPYEPIYALFGKRLRATRLRQGRTLDYIAVRLNRPQSKANIAAMEKGIRRPPLHLACEIADILGVSLESLISP